jgi:hypothetical protein
MTDEQINVKIAELALDWNPNGEHWQQLRDGSFRTADKLPNYCTDLNAMHEAEKTLSTGDEQTIYLDYFYSTTPNNFAMVCLPAKQRALAFLKTKGIQPTE